MGGRVHIDQAAEEALSSRSFGGIAHDVRGAVGVVSGALDELERTFVGDAAIANAALLALARRGVARLIGTADRCAVLAAFSRPPDPVVADVGEVFALAMTAADAAYGRRAVRVIPATEHGAAAIEARALQVALSDATVLAIKVARTEVLGRLAVDSGGLKVSLVADAESDWLEQSWSARAWLTEESQDHTLLAMRVLDVVAHRHGGSVHIGSGEGATTIEFHLPSTMTRRP